MKVILVEHYFGINNTGHLHNILVFETLKEVEEYIKDEYEKGLNNFVVFEREVGNLNEEQLNDLRNLKTLDDFDYIFGNFENDKIIAKII